DPLLLEIVRANLLGAAAALHLVASSGRQLLRLPLTLGLEKTRAENAQRLLLVLELALLVLAGDDEAGGQVSDADGGVGRVDRLAAGAARPVHVDLEVGGIDVDGDHM